MLFAEPDRMEEYGPSFTEHVRLHIAPQGKFFELEEIGCPKSSCVQGWELTRENSIVRASIPRKLRQKKRSLQERGKRLPLKIRTVHRKTIFRP